MDLPMATSQGWTPAFTGRYDDEEIDIITSYIRPKSLVLDIGACLGLYTVPLALRAAATDGALVAFEPVSGNLDVLRRNVGLNRLAGSVTIHPFGLGDDSFSEVIGIERGGTGNAVIGLVERNDLVPQDEQETIAVRRLDDLELPNLPCSLIKMDVEGFEMAALRGADAYISRHRPVIFGEFGLSYLRARGEADDATLRWAQAHDYTVAEFGYTHPNRFSDRRVISLKTLRQPDEIRSGTSLLLLPS
jgi:FkbM family methyltransferase